MLYLRGGCFAVKQKIHVASLMCNDIGFVFVE